MLIMTYHQDLKTMNNPYESADYLGDGVYIKWDGYNFVLTANHHDEYQATAVIYLEPPVLAAINRFVKRMENKTK